MSDSPSNPAHDQLAEAARQAENDAGLDALRADLQAHLPDFELGACIGRGGMGAVFRARQRKLDRTVAVKALLPPPGEVEGWAARFRREAQALARLQHPGIVTVHDYGQAGELAWLVMELVEGANLRALLDDGRLRPAEALAIVPPICEALQYAHERGIVHRDIKPENVLLDLEGRVKLVDFGLAKLTADEPLGLTRSDQAMGTPRYMAPEQLERPLEVDHRADIFSLGMVIYEMLTGHVPAGVVEPPSRKVEVDVRLDEVVLRALQREPARRYQSAVDLATGVKDAGTGAPAAPPAAHRAATQPVASGWTPADLLAALMLPTVLFSVALTGTQYGPRGASVAEMSRNVSEAIEVWIRFLAVAVFWLALPIVTTIHSRKSRRRDHLVTLAMPTVRTVWAGLGVALLLVAAAASEPFVNRSGGPVLTILQGLMLPIGLAAALLGAWSQKGTHRRLLDETTAGTLFWATASLLVVPTTIGVLAAFVGGVKFDASASIYSTSLPLTVQLPIVVAAVLAFSLHRRQKIRAATMALTTGAVMTTAAHLLGSISYGDWTLPALGCLFLATVVGLVAVAGSASPQLRSTTKG